jgi:uncharacterized Rmd1/YagE family protein
MEQLTVRAYGYASPLPVRELAGLWPEAEGVALAGRERVLLLLPGPSVQALVLLGFGALVCIGLDTAEADRMNRTLQQRLGPATAPPNTEDHLLVVTPGRPAEVRFDRVVVPSASPAVLELVALLLAQSVVLDHYEEDVGRLLGATERLAGALASRGRLPGRVRDLRKFIGASLRTRQQVLGSLALLDKPESTWSDEALDRLYLALRRDLELGDRLRALEAKLDVLQGSVVLAVELTQTRAAWRLELAIVVLILAELLLSLMGWARSHG